MANTGEMIAALMKRKGEAAPVITHALSEIGNGSMMKGISRIISFSTEKGVTKGRIQGVVIGTLGTIVTYEGVKYMKIRIAAHKAEEKVIYEAFEAAVAAVEAEKMPFSDEVAGNQVNSIGIIKEDTNFEKSNSDVVSNE